VDVLKQPATTDTERAKQVDAVRALLMYPDGDHTKRPCVDPRNVATVLGQDPHYRYRLSWNEFHAAMWWDGEALQDHHLTRIRLELLNTYRLRVSTRELAEMVALMARDHKIHPVRDYLTGLRWDGTDRLDGVLPNYAGAEDSEINRILGRRWMLSAVARIMQPGCKVDTVLILAGPQGYGKSTFFKTLAGAEWFRDDALDIRNKDAAMQIRGAWIYELAELASTRIRDSESVKAFISRSVDHYRPPYARFVVTEPRQSVFCGTTNEASFLNDPTGARRFWPVHVDRMPDLKSLERDRDQLWAEAFEALMGGERWWLELNEDRQLQDHQERYQSRDPWHDLVADWVDRHPSQVTVSAILDFAIELPKDRRNKSHEMRIGGILTALGFEKRRVMRSGIRRVEWVRS
jgi:putative DNA primase/helicase